MSSSIHSAIHRILLDIGAEHAIFARDQSSGTYLSKKAGDARRRVWTRLVQAGFRVGEIARATGANVSTVSMATADTRPLPETPTMPATPSKPTPQPTAPKPDRSDDLFGWHHYIILEAAAKADPEPFNYRRLLESDHRTIGWIDRLQRAGLIDSGNDEEDPSGHHITINKAGRAALARWKRERGEKPSPDQIEADYYRTAIDSTRRANGLPVPGRRSGQVPVVPQHQLDAAADDDLGDGFTEAPTTPLGSLPKDAAGAEDPEDDQPEG